MKFASLFLAVAVAVLPACKKKEGDAPPPTTTEPAGSGSAAGSAGSAGSAAEPPKEAPKETPPAPAAATDADFISVFATHAEPKPGDPVEVKFQKFAVTKASFDPKNLEGGTATIAIDLAAISTGSEKRDGHLKTPDYLDASKFTTATVDVSNVKKKDDTHYTADAKVDLHGVQKTYPVEFEVVATTEDSVKVKSSLKFSRTDFNVGKPEPSKEPGKEEAVAKELEVKLQLTLKKT